jgi:hypothetical protein
MSAAHHLLFLAFVALATYVQNLTGFAFGLILLGLVGLLHLAPLPDVVNVVSVLALMNAVMVLVTTRPRLERRTLLPTISASLVGVVLGVALLTWLSDNVVVGLRLLLGLTIIASAVLLVRHAVAQKQPSSRASFCAVGLVAGVMGGLFSTAGPPLVYHYYRQPMPMADVRGALVAVFGANALLRLALQAGTGRLSGEALWMSLEAAPVVLTLGWLAVYRPSRWSMEAVRRNPAAQLVVVGLGLVIPAGRALLG